MTSHRVSAKARQLMRDNPGMKYQQALAHVTAIKNMTPRFSTWLTNLGITDIENFDPAPLWEANEHTDDLVIPFGKVCTVEAPRADTVDNTISSIEIEGRTYTPPARRKPLLNLTPTDETLFLNLAEPWHGGTGPHGFVQGKTGTGKSYLISTLVSAMATLYSPSKVNFILADFKAGATFDSFENLPHVLANLTCLESDPEDVARFCKMLDGEVERRTTLLHDARAKNIYDYRKMCAENASLQVLPHLVVIVDEYAEYVLSHKGDDIPFLKAIRQGHDIGIHVILSSQFTPTDVFEEPDLSRFRFAMSLATASKKFSSAVLNGDVRAAVLPAGKGHGLFKRTNVDGTADIVPFQGMQSPADTFEDMKKAVSTLNGGSKNPSPLWLPSLRAPLSLRDISKFTEPDKQLEVVIGAVDDPFHHAHLPLTVDLSSPLNIVGEHETGKSTALVTLAAQLAKTRGNNVMLAGFGMDTSITSLPNVLHWVCSPSDDYADKLESLVTSHQSTPMVVMIDNVDRLTSTSSQWKSTWNRVLAAALDPKSNISLVVTSTAPMFSGTTHTVLNLRAFVDYEEKQPGKCHVTLDGKELDARVAVPVLHSIAAMEPRYRGLPKRYHQTVDYTEDIHHMTNKLRNQMEKSGKVTRPAVASPVPSLTEWMSVLGVTDIETFDPVPLWETNERTDSLNFPLGKVCDENYTLTDETLFLDISEMSRGGTGAHGLFQGRTGSGKSVLLNNTVLALSTLYSPSKVNFVLVDFKGDYTFKELAVLPHVLAYVPSVDSHEDRARALREAVKNEMCRREELLFKHRARDINEFRKLESDGTSLPHLVFIVDEYHENMKMFTDIACKGRSLGIHLLLCSHPSILYGIVQHLTYAVSLGAGPEDAARDVMFKDRRYPVTRRAQYRGQGLVRYFDANHQEIVTTFQALRPEEDSARALVRKLSEQEAPDGPERDVWCEVVNSTQE